MERKQKEGKPLGYVVLELDSDGLLYGLNEDIDSPADIYYDLNVAKRALANMSTSKGRFNKRRGRRFCVGSIKEV